MISTRKQLLVSLAGLSMYALLAVGSTGSAPAIIANAKTIMDAVSTVQFLLEGARLLSAATSSSVDAAYVDLSDRIQTQDFSLSSIQEMEATYAGMRAQADSLSWTLANTRSSAEQLFEMLERLANENETPELQQLMETDAEEKRRQFNDLMAEAEGAMGRVDASIQKYKDILGFVQYNLGGDQLAQYMAEIQGVIGQAEALDGQIQRAIDEGMRIVASVDRPAFGATE